MLSVYVRVVVYQVIVFNEVILVMYALDILSTISYYSHIIISLEKSFIINVPTGVCVCVCVCVCACACVRACVCMRACVCNISGHYC